MAGDRKVPLVATESQFYGTRQLRSGNKFQATELDAADMRALGLAKDDIDPVGKVTRPTLPKPKRKYVKSGKYKRRDLRAED